MYCSSFIASASPYSLLVCSPLHCDTDIASVINTTELLGEKLKNTEFLPCHKKLKQMGNKAETSLNNLSQKIIFSILVSCLTL